MRLRIGLFLLFMMLLSACNVPDPIPTATPTPLESPTPSLPSATPTPEPTATNTPLPAYLDIDETALGQTTVLLRNFLIGNPREILLQLAKRFNAENPYGITVNADSSLTEETFLSDSKRTGLVIASRDRLQQWQEQGLTAADLTAYAESEQVGLQNAAPFVDTIQRADWELPLWYDPAFLFYNRTWAQELGFTEDPYSFAEFAKQASAAQKFNFADKELDKHGTGGWIIPDDPTAVMSLLINFGAFDGTLEEFRNQGEDSIFTKCGEWARSLYDDGGIWASRLSEPYDYFADRYALFYSGTYSDVERQLNAMENSDHADDNWDLIPYPRKTDNGSLNEARIFGRMTSAMIPETDAETQYAAWLFLRWLYETDGAAELAVAADAWPVQDDAAVTKIVQNSGKDKLFVSLDWRKNISPVQTDSAWQRESAVLADGFGFIFNPSALPENIPLIWEQIRETNAELTEIGK